MNFPDSAKNLMPKTKRTLIICLCVLGSVAIIAAALTGNLEALINAFR